MSPQAQTASPDLKVLAEELIAGQNTMTLATTNRETAWAAPVYYVYLAAGFYFFSDPGSRHIQEALACDQAAAAIFAPAQSWQDIRGLQMSGRVTLVGAGLEALRVIQAYLRKYAFTREFFKTGEALDLATFSTRFRVRLYAFRAQTALYLDNSLRFGFREAVSL